MKFTDIGKMIKYRLHCDAGHDFDAQATDGLLECPSCASRKVEKAIMAPSIATGAGEHGGRLGEMRRSMAEAARRARDYVEKNFEYVGDRFPEEARRIHYGEKDSPGIFGEATGAEVKELVEEGVPIAPLPGPSKEDKAAGAARPRPVDFKKTLN
jgi:hypothetical protein